MSPGTPLGRGFTLVELVVALFVAALLTAGTVQLARSASQGYRLQRNLSALQENARFGLQMIGNEVAEAGFSPTPWNAGSLPRALEGSSDEASIRGDTLVLRRRSDRNCFENANPALAADGRSRFFLRVTGFAVSAAGQLSMTCRYGPDPDSLVTQINGLGLVENVRSLQALFAVDDSADGNAERWGVAGAWDDESKVLGVRLGLLVLSPDTFDRPPRAEPVTVAGAAVPVPGQRLFRAVDTTVALRGRINR